MQKSLWNIFKTFFKIGTLLLGGGYVILPLLQSEIVDKKRWLTSNDIIEFFALSQSLPGVIAANISIFVGHKLTGIKGAIIALTGIIMPAFLAIILIANIIGEIIHKHCIKSIFAGVGVGVVVLILLTIKEMWGKSITDKFTTVVFIFAVILSCLNISPIIIILGSIIAGLLFNANNKIKNKENQNI